MDKESTRRLIKKTFQNSFNKKDFIYFIKNLLNQYDESKVFHLHGCYIPKAFKNFIKIYERVGTYVDPEGKKIDILIVYLKRKTTIDRARTAQRNFIARYLKERDEKDAGLVAFVSPQEEDWRFSFVKMEYKFEKTPKGDVKVKEEFTPARRYSFLVGKNESSHTAQSCFVDILVNDTHSLKLNEIGEAFNIEKVTKEFYEKYRNLFFQVKDALDEVVKKDEEVRQEFQEKGVNVVDFTKKLLGQIVFIYFLQKKGWFGVKKGQKWDSGSKHFLRELFEKKHCDYKNFFNNVLEPLFYEALRNDRSYDDHYFSYFNCKIPFLNGGLFDPIKDYDWAKTDILLPNTLFSNQIKTKEGDIGIGILDFFDRYNFTVKEDEPLEKEVAVDPEMLGKVFENLLEVKDRKSKGTYYTPREIVHYMCQQSLINYLYTEVNSEQKSRTKEEKIQMKLLGKPDPIQQSLIIEKDSNIISKEDIEKLIKYGDTTIENDNHVVIKGEETKTYSFKLPENIRKNAEIIDKALKNIRVCDPAIGSGAFPVGMMNEIIRARNVLTSYLSLREAEAPKQSRTIYDFKRHAIQNCLYGVDIDPGAVEIAKLRLWLSLIVDEEDIKQIKPLPNLDYKIMQGNSLISEFMGIDLDNDKENNEKEKLFSTNESNELYEMLKVKKDELLNQPNINKKKILKKEIENLIIKIFEVKLQEQKSDYFKKLIEIEEKYERHPVKEEREREIKREKDVLSRKTGFNLEEAEKQLRQYTSNQKIRPFFPWKLYFSEVFKEKNGFDVVIANPPYVRQEKIRDQKPLLQKQGYEIYNSTSDLYTYFYERSYQILKPNGFSCFISSNKWMRAKYGEKLRKFFKEKTKAVNLVDFGGYEVFEATVDTNILLFQKNKSTPNHTFNVINIQSDFTKDTELNVYSKKHSLSITQKEIDSRCFTFADDATMKLKAKIEDRGVPLKDWDIKICFGIKTGFSEAFIINNETKEKFCKQDSKITEILKPILRGRDINKWHYKWAGLWLINSHNGLRGKGVKRINVAKDYPIIYKHLQQYQENLEIRQDKGDNWTNLRNCAYLDEFEKEKILYQEMSYESSFSWDKNKMFVNQSCYIIANANKYILSLLNSKLINDYFKLISQTLGTGAFRWIKQYVEQIPIPKISSTEQKSFIELVDHILAITKDKDYLENPKMQTEAKEYEYQIDQMVYKLYNLTPEEIEIVEGFKNK